MTIGDLNRLDRAAFVETLGWVFEDSPWVAERAFDARPFAGVDALHAAMTGQVERATSGENLALLQAHPDLGARARLSAASTGEQAGAGSGQLDAKRIRESSSPQRRLPQPIRISVSTGGEGQHKARCVSRASGENGIVAGG